MEMEENREIEKRVENLYHRDSRTAYENFKILEQESRRDESVYSFLDIFAAMMEDENSYVRTRGLLLIAANAKWDRDNKIDELIDKYLKHIMDAKPITARQCIKALPEIARYKTGLKDDIVLALKNARPELRYRESMVSLVRGDIGEALRKMEDL